MSLMLKRKDGPNRVNAICRFQVSEALQKNKFLTSLDLSGNRITDGGAEVGPLHCTNPGLPSNIPSFGLIAGCSEAVRVQHATTEGLQSAPLHNTLCPAMRLLQVQSTHNCMQQGCVLLHQLMRREQSQYW